MEYIQVTAPATIGNIGPGFDVLGLAVKHWGDRLEARKTDAGVTMSTVNTQSGWQELSKDPDKNTAGIAAQETLKLLGIDQGVDLILHKGLPLGSGLGSSAASAVAAAFAVNELYGRPMTKEELILPATIAEERVSGGFFADNTAPALLGGATLTRSYMPLDVTRIGSIENLIIILVTPEIVVLTREARDMLPKCVSMKDFIFNMANTSLITAAFSKNDYSLFARSLNDVVVEPVRSKLITGFDAVKTSALKSGADGLAISGSGPTVFAITDTPDRAPLIEAAMVQTFKAHGVNSISLITEVDPEGARIVGS